MGQQIYNLRATLASLYGPAEKSPDQNGNRQTPHNPARTNREAGSDAPENGCDAPKNEAAMHFERQRHTSREAATHFDRQRRTATGRAPQHYNRDTRGRPQLERIPTKSPRDLGGSVSVLGRNHDAPTASAAKGVYSALRRNIEIQKRQNAI